MVEFSSLRHGLRTFTRFLQDIFRRRENHGTLPPDIGTENHFERFQECPES